ncbi:hypothetical protein [Streptomyces sp. NPDC096030]|uniref:hypothetical protein n=1 Tax=Streptomyces sp. NPDC096030 TaxID=3155423 RepID=UPI003317292A
MTTTVAVTVGVVVGQGGSVAGGDVKLGGTEETGGGVVKGRVCGVVTGGDAVGLPGIDGEEIVAGGDVTAPPGDREAVDGVAVTR